MTTTNNTMTVKQLANALSSPEQARESIQVALTAIIIKAVADGDTTSYDPAFQAMLNRAQNSPAIMLDFKRIVRWLTYATGNGIRLYAEDGKSKKGKAVKAGSIRVTGEIKLTDNPVSWFEPIPQNKKATDKGNSNGLVYISQLKKKTLAELSGIVSYEDIEDLIVRLNEVKTMKASLHHKK